jgi:hypothetical protein
MRLAVFLFGMGFIKNVTAIYVFEYKWRFFVQIDLLNSK